jgi:thioredoxin-dependent peroxiredoxin
VRQPTRRSLLAAALVLPSWPHIARAADVGAVADAFTLPAALDGSPFTYSLRDALARGPVVLYFFPVAFSEGCSIEAHTFAEAIDQFKALGASVIGVSTDDIGTLTRFSKQACQGKFPVASDADRRVTAAFDAAMRSRPELSTRVSFVIAPDGKIVFVYRNLEPTRHVDRTLGALRQWRLGSR